MLLGKGKAFTIDEAEGAMCSLTILALTANIVVGLLSLLSANFELFGVKVPIALVKIEYLFNRF